MQIVFWKAGKGQALHTQNVSSHTEARRAGQKPGAGVSKLLRERLDTPSVTGFAFTDGRWHATGFRSDEKYLVRRAKVDDLIPAKWVVIEIGAEYPTAWCEDDFEQDHLICEAGLTKWRMNKKTLRFMAAYVFGYVDGADNNDDTPAIRIGKCSAL